MPTVPRFLHVVLPSLAMGAVSYEGSMWTGVAYPNNVLEPSGTAAIGTSARLFGFGVAKTATYFASQVFRSMGFDVLHEVFGSDGLVSWWHVADFADLELEFRSDNPGGMGPQNVLNCPVDPDMRSSAQHISWKSNLSAVDFVRGPDCGFWTRQRTSDDAIQASSRIWKPIVLARDPIKVIRSNIMWGDAWLARHPKVYPSIAMIHDVLGSRYRDGLLQRNRKADVTAERTRTVLFATAGYVAGWNVFGRATIRDRISARARSWRGASIAELAEGLRGIAPEDVPPAARCSNLAQANCEQSRAAAEFLLGESCVSPGNPSASNVREPPAASVGQDCSGIPVVPVEYPRLLIRVAATLLYGTEYLATGRGRLVLGAADWLARQAKGAARIRAARDREKRNENVHDRNSTEYLYQGFNSAVDRFGKDRHGRQRVMMVLVPTASQSRPQSQGNVAAHGMDTEQRVAHTAAQDRIKRIRAAFEGAPPPAHAFPDAPSDREWWPAEEIGWRELCLECASMARHMYLTALQQGYSYPLPQTIGTCVDGLVADGTVGRVPVAGSAWWDSLSLEGKLDYLFECKP